MTPLEQAEMVSLFRGRIRDVDDWSIVRMDDGRVGVKGRQRRGCMVMTDVNLGVIVDGATEVDVLAWPAQTAACWMEAYNAAALADQGSQP